MHTVLEVFLHFSRHVEVLSKVDHLYQNTSRGAVRFLNGLSMTTSGRILPLSIHHYLTVLVNLPYNWRHAIGKMDGIQRSKSFINLIPPLPILEVPINTLGYGFKGRNWVATLLEVPDDVPPQQISAVCPPPNLPVTPPTPNQVGPACSKRGT